MPDSRPQWMDDYERACGVVLKPGGPSPDELEEARDTVTRAASESGDETLISKFESMVDEWLDEGDAKLAAFSADAPEDPSAFDYKDEDQPPPGQEDVELSKSVQMDRLAKVKRGETT